METSDRGMIDVERFDREPERPLFHGLVGDLDPDKLGGMTTYEKVPIVLDIIGAETMSRRMAASLVDIDASIKTWPQLASAVSLGGAINTDVARRIALGTMTTSGRYFVDVEGIVCDAGGAGTATETTPGTGTGTAPTPAPTRTPATATATAPATATATATATAPTPTPTPTPAPALAPASTPLPPGVLERLVRCGALAPSGGNCQPWRFTYGSGVLRCWHDEERSRSFLDFQSRATHAAFGALAENLRLTAAVAEVGAALQSFPDPSRPALVLQATLGGAPERLTPEDAELARFVELRATNRRLGERAALPAGAADALVDIAARAGAHLQIVSEAKSLEALGELLGAGDRVRLLSRVMHREMMSEIRWSAREAAERRDGLDVATLELTPTDRAAMRLVSSWSVMAALRAVGGGQGLLSPARKSIAAASAVGVLRIPRAAADDRARAEAFLRGGVALQRVWLLATRLGVAFQPMTAITYLFARLEEGGGAGLEVDESRELAGLRERYRAILGAAAAPHSAPSSEVMLFRLAVAGAPSARSLRRTVDEMLTLEPTP